MIIVTAIAAIWFCNLEYRKLVRPDEGRYAEIPREMAATGDWTTPRLNGIKYFEKPPLQYWATAAAYTAFGEHHWTARLWPALTGFLGILMIWFTGSRLFGATAGLFAGLVLASSLLYVLIGHVITLDMSLSFFMSAAVCAFLLGLRDSINQSARRWWLLAAWTSLAGAILSKGLIGLLLPGTTLILYSLLQRDLAVLGRLHLGKGLLLLLALTAPWFWAVSQVNPEFARFFFVHEHFERFLTTSHRRDQPWWYFVPILLVGLMPWTLIALGALVRAWNRPSIAQAFSPLRFLTIYTVFVYVFFSVSGSKLPSYLLPMFPAIALIAGEQLAGISSKTLRRHLVVLTGIGLICLAATPFVTRLASVEVPLPLYQSYTVWLVGAAAALVAGCVAAMILLRRARMRIAVVAMSAAGLISAQLALTGHESLAPASSSHGLVSQIKDQLRPGIPFYSVGTYEQTLPFYIKRTVTLVAFLDEMEFGIRQEPHLWIPDISRFEKTWREQDEALAIMNPEMHAELQQRRLPMRIIGRDTRRIVVSRR